ncbi:MAG TPA: FG-GAP-like repeat-containing protein [Myxococcota bacterium]|nr:FG-GAP-like repeat-containing protein [Myxococcota bacterium]
MRPNPKSSCLPLALLLAVSGCASESETPSEVLDTVQDTTEPNDGEDTADTAPADETDAGGDISSPSDVVDTSSPTDLVDTSEPPEDPCGDGVVAEGEECDDDNRIAGDGCSDRCVVESGYACRDGSPSICGDVDECLEATDECSPMAECENTEGAYRCECLGGYVGDGRTCVLVDPCEPGEFDCPEHSTCNREAPGVYTCVCDPGFGQNGEVCSDLDECVLGIDTCHAQAMCSNLEGGFGCECRPGFSGDGFTCENIDDCASAPCRNGGTCQDGVGSFTCACAPGYSGDTCATDIDDCASSPCLNGGTCDDGVNSFTCQCIASYTGPTCEVCPGTRADCNDDPGDGCETIVESDTNHCGTCNSPCEVGQICSNRICQQPPDGQVPGSAFAVANTHGPAAPAVGDVDRDGVLDVLVANLESGSATTPSGSLSIFRGQGDGTLFPEAYYTGAPLSSNAVVAADLNADGWFDAVTVNGQVNLSNTHGSVTVYPNLGPTSPGVFGPPTSYTTGAPGSVHLCAADFDRDGAVDVATTSVTTNQVSVLWGSLTGALSAPQLISIMSTGGVQSTIACRDFDNDGDAEIVVTSPASARLSVLVNTQNRTFATPVTYTNSQNGQTAGLTFGDADGDGLTDILSNGAAGSYLYFFKGQAGAVFSAGVSSSTGAGAVANSALGVVSGDFNGDGRLDAYILVTTNSGGVRPMTGNGSGGFASGTVVSTGTSPALNALVAADMDGDGYLDLVLTNKGSSTVTVIPNGL